MVPLGLLALDADRLPRPVDLGRCDAGALGEDLLNLQGTGGAVQAGEGVDALTLSIAYGEERHRRLGSFGCVFDLEPEGITFISLALDRQFLGEVVHRCGGDPVMQGEHLFQFVGAGCAVKVLYRPASGLGHVGLLNIII